MALLLWQYYSKWSSPWLFCYGSIILNGAHHGSSVIAILFLRRLCFFPCVSGVQKVIDILLVNNIPHNVVMYRGAPFNAYSATSSVIRILVIPRKPVYGTAIYRHTPLHSVIM